jgi:dienelactone hydrolase
MNPLPETQTLPIPLAAVTLEGDLVVPRHAAGLVVFAHGSGSSRKSRRNREVARHLQDSGFATLLFDLLTEEEDRRPEARFDIALLADRLAAVTRWLRGQSRWAQTPLGYFGASTGAAAALRAAAELGPQVDAVVSRGGRPDLALPFLGEVRAATLLIVGGRDAGVIELNQEAYAALDCAKRFEIVPGATHLFEEPGALETVARLAADWFAFHLARELPVAESAARRS